MNTSRQRRRLLVNSRYQLTHLAVTLTANVVLMLLMATLISWFYLLFFKGNLVCDHNRLFPLYLAAIALMVVMFLTLWSLVRSRTVAGMMRKLELVLRAAAVGNLPDRPMAFRKHDPFAGLAEPLNGCFVRMRRLEQQRREAVRVLEEVLSEADRSTDAGRTRAESIEAALAGLGRTEGQGAER